MVRPRDGTNGGTTCAPRGGGGVMQQESEDLVSCCVCVCFFVFKCVFKDNDVIDYTLHNHNMVFTNFWIPFFLFES